MFETASRASLVWRTSCVRIKEALFTDARQLAAMVAGKRKDGGIFVGPAKNDLRAGLTRIGPSGTSSANRVKISHDTAGSEEMKWPSPGSTMI